MSAPLADGALDASRIASGTDNAPALQACVDHALSLGNCASIEPGAYYTSDTLELGPGDTFRSGFLQGAGAKYRGSASFSGTALLCDTEGQGIAVSGARGSAIKALSVVGNTWGHIESQGFGTLYAVTDDTDRANWFAFPDLRYAPQAGVAVDPYPGDAFSSGVTLEDVDVVGWGVGLAIQPCDVDGNGDFIHLTRTNIEFCAVGVSAGNTQGRNFGFTDGNISQVHTAFANGIHGRQTGKFGGRIDNAHIAFCIQWLDCPLSAYAGPMSFTGCYGESMWRIGNWGTVPAAANAPLSFTSCEFRFDLQATFRGVPAYTLSAGFPNPISFAGCVFAAYPTVLTFGGAASGYEFDNCSTYGPDLTTAPLYRRIASNFLAGGLMFQVSTAQRNVPERFAVKANWRYNLTTGAAPAEKLGSVCRSELAFNVCAWSKRARPTNSPTHEVQIPPLWSAVAKAGLTLSLDGSTLTITFASRSESAFAMKGPLPGDVVFDDVTGMVFFVRSRSGLVVLAEAQTNINGTGPIVPFSTTSGNLYFGNARLYLPSYATFGDVTSGSNTIANVGRDDGWAGYLAAEVQVGDWLYVNEEIDRTFPAALALVTAVGANSITLSGNATRSASRKALGFFVRQPPANV